MVFWARVRRRGVLAGCAAAGALVLVPGGAVAGGAAAASPGAGAVVVSGTGTIFMSKAYIAEMAAHDIVITAEHPLSVVTTPPKYTVTTWAVSGGDADLAACTGFVDLHAGSLVTNVVTGASVLLDDIRFDVANDSVDYTLATPAGPKTIIGLLLGGRQGGRVHGRHASYRAADLFFNPAAGAKLDADLGTTAFSDTGQFGKFATSFTLSAPAPASGPASCG